MTVKIPTRFEHILGDDRLSSTPLIVRVPHDMKQFDILRRTTEIQGGGILSFLSGASGCGKTTSVWSASINLSDRFEPVLSVPATVPLREISNWLQSNVPDKTNRSLLILMDGREASDDTVGLRQFMAELNQFLRGRPDVIVCWPTTNEGWKQELISIARMVGGKSLTPASADVTISGPPKAAWNDVLERLFIQLDQRLEDLGMSTESITQAIDDNEAVGDFLGAVRDEIASRVDMVQLAQDLPEILFVVTSTSAVVGEANRLRRAGTMVLKAEELVGYSPRSESGKWWQKRNESPQHHLAYVISLFRAKLVTMTPSSVVYSIAEYGPEDMRSALREKGISKSPANADTTFQSTDFCKFINGSGVNELTSTIKGKTSDSVLNAYAHIQQFSARRHKVINQAICALAEKNVPTFTASSGIFEVDLGEQDTYADAVISLEDRELHLEFHHLSDAHCKAASIAAYIMKKLRVYANHYNITPR
ncbi:hypothetical protein [Streptomyces sp. WAC 06725]|uniref:hypothetical protein n=1 Tax=Streptomyces sp. WAC 06725 TaxID=2203209 RepID=UPI000F741723|nr:hypothetical protein [Streptomyces sp. WAC 06725]